MRARACAAFHCHEPSDGVHVASPLLDYCKNCAPIVACNRARIISEHRRPIVPLMSGREE